MQLWQHLCIYSQQKYLKDNQFEESWLALQAQSHTKLYTYPKQIQFLRKIILKGDFQQAIELFSTLDAHLGQKNYKKCCLTIYKQKLYELINVPNEITLKKLFQKDLLNICTEEEFQNLFTLLTCRSTQQIQGLENWTIAKGRLKIFEELFPILQGILINNKSINSYLNSPEPELNLDEAIALYLQKNVYHNQQKLEQNESSSRVATKNVNKSLGSQVRKSGIDASQIQQHIGQDSKQIALQLSESQYQKSQIGKSKIYQNPSNIKQNESQGFNANQKSSLIKESNKYQKSNLQNNPSMFYQSDTQQINQISQEQQKSDTIKSNRPIQRSQTNNYFKTNNSDQQSQEDQSQSSHPNEYEDLEQTNSVVYNNNEGEKDNNQNFTFSHHQNFFGQNNSTIQHTKPRKIFKLSTISDNKAIRTCQFSHNGNFFAVGTNSSYLKIFYIEDLFAQNKSQQIQPIYEINNLHSKSIFCLDWSKDESSMVTCSNDLTIKTTTFNPEFSSHETSVIGRHESCIRMVKFNEQANKIFSCGDDSLIKIWDMGKVKRCYNLKGHKNGINAFKLSSIKSNENQLYSVSKDSTIKKWDLRTLQCIATSKPQQSEMTYIANNTDRIAVSNKNGNTLFFDENLNLQYQVKMHEQQIRSIQCLRSEQQDIYLTASFDGHVGMFSEKTIHSADYFQHNQNNEDKVVFATFLNHPQYKGFASTSTLGLCHIYSFY